VQQYLLSIYQPDGDPPPADELAAIGRDLAALRGELEAAGAWVFAGGLEEPGTAKVIHPRRKRMAMTDGPYVEAKEHIGGVNIIAAASLDEALEWARKLALATTLPIEVRAFRAEPEGR
jgi:hypothetical protein